MVIDCDLENLPPPVANLPWTHNFVFIEKVKDVDKRSWCATKCFENALKMVGVKRF